MNYYGNYYGVLRFNLSVLCMSLAPAMASEAVAVLSVAATFSLSMEDSVPLGFTFSVGLAELLGPQKLPMVMGELSLSDHLHHKCLVHLSSSACSK